MGRWLPKSIRELQVISTIQRYKDSETNYANTGKKFHWERDQGKLRRREVKRDPSKSNSFLQFALIVPRVIRDPKLGDMNRFVGYRQ